VVTAPTSTLAPAVRVAPEGVLVTGDKAGQVSAHLTDLKVPEVGSESPGMSVRSGSSQLRERQVRPEESVKGERSQTTEP